MERPWSKIELEKSQHRGVTAGWQRCVEVPSVDVELNVWQALGSAIDEGQHRREAACAQAEELTAPVSAKAATVQVLEDELATLKSLRGLLAAGPGLFPSEYPPWLPVPSIHRAPSRSSAYRPGYEGS